MVGQVATLNETADVYNGSSNFDMYDVHRNVISTGTFAVQTTRIRVEAPYCGVEMRMKQMKDITHRFIETNGIRMQVAEAGQGPLVLLLHGFPESWYSWRHQLAALAQAGYHAVAPDQRGYGQTDRPAEIEMYTQLYLVGDTIGLLDALEEEQAVIVGHDWGGLLARVACAFSAISWNIPRRTWSSCNARSTSCWIRTPRPKAC